MKKMSCFAFLVAAFSIAAPSSVVRADEQPGATHHTSITHRWPNGIAVTPIEQERSELADILGLVSWKFEIQNPKPETDLVIGTLEIREQGKAKHKKMEFAIFPQNLDKQGRFTLWIGFLPIESDFRDSRHVKFLLRAKGHANIPVRIANPFRFADEYNREVARIKGGAPGELMLLHTKGAIPDPKDTRKDRRIDLFMTLHTEPVKGKVWDTEKAPPPEDLPDIDGEQETISSIFN